IPPALDQVLIGAIDRSRNPELKMSLVLGLNEAVFPLPPASGTLLTETDRNELSVFLDNSLGLDLKQRLARERYLRYIAFTRARERIIFSFSERGEGGETLNPSPFIARLKQLFLSLAVETFPSVPGELPDWIHVSELVPAVLRGEVAVPPKLAELPQIAPV